MIRKPVNELDFVQARGPMSTIEIDLDTLRDKSSGYAHLVASSLTQLAVTDPSVLATVYVFQGPSVNFGNYGYCAFFGVAGNRRVLDTLYTSFCNEVGLKVRHSDPIHQSQMIRQYHIEEGRLWCPEEEGVWLASAAREEREDSDYELPEGEVAGCCADEKPDLVGRATEEQSERDEELTLSAPSRTGLPVRFRAARSDASVGSISRTIEDIFGLPAGSVALRGPDRKVLRSDASIRTLRRRWE